jgi:hypothetical protein
MNPDDSIAYAYILVFSTSHAIQIEQWLIEKKVPCRLVPVPRHLSSDCGVCVRILKSDIEQVHKLTEQAGIELVGIHSE